MKKRARRLLLAVVSLLIVVGISIAYLSHGYLWSINRYIYAWMFRSMPSPPGFVPGTDMVDLPVYYSPPTGFRSYNVEMDYAEAVDFFVTKFPPSGWELWMKQEGGVTDVSDITPGAYRKGTTIVFTYRHWCWLKVRVSVQVDKDGKQVDPYPLVRMEISTDGQEIMRKANLSYGIP